MLAIKKLHLPGNYGYGSAFLDNCRIEGAVKRAIATAALLLMLSGCATAEKKMELTEAQLTVLEGIFNEQSNLITHQHQTIIKLIRALDAEKSKVCI